MPMVDFDLAGDLALFARVLRRAEGGKLVLAIFVTSIVVTIANMLAQVRLNEWNGQFFDAVGRKDLSAFVHFLWTFVVIIAILLTLTVAQTFLQERLKFRLREWLARHLLVEWLKPMRVYQLSFAGRYGRRPRPENTGRHAPARRLHRRSWLWHRLFTAPDHRLRRGALGVVGASHLPGGGS